MLQYSHINTNEMMDSMFFDRLVEKFEKKRRLVEMELIEKEQQEQQEYKENMRMISYLENGGVELETKKLIERFLNNEKLYKQTFRVNEYKIGVFFRFGDVSEVYPFGKHYYKGGIGIILKMKDEVIDYRIAALPRTISSVSYGHTSHTSSRWEVTNKHKYDIYNKIPNLFNQSELHVLWKKIIPTVPVYDDF